MVLTFTFRHQGLRAGSGVAARNLRSAFGWMLASGDYGSMTVNETGSLRTPGEVEAGLVTSTL